MLKRVASKSTTPLLNKLNKSSAIHPGPGWSPVHVDQRLPAAACNIAQWRRGGPKGCVWKGGGGGVASMQGLTLSKAHAGRNYVRMQLQHLHSNPPPTSPPSAAAAPPPFPLLPSWSILHTGGGGSTLRLDILSVDGTIIWEEMGAMVEADALMQALRARFKLCGWGGGL